MKISKLLQDGVQEFLEMVPEITAHMENHDNPHGVTADQTGLATEREEIAKIRSDLEKHRRQSGIDHVSGSIQTTHLAFGAVSAEKLGAESVITSKIKNGAVTEQKIDSGAVTREKIGDGAVTEDKIQDGAVSAEKLAEKSVRRAHISGALITEIDGKVDKEDGKMLSQNNFTNAYRDKLDAIRMKDGEVYIDLADYVKKKEPIEMQKSDILIQMEGTRTIPSVSRFISATRDDANDLLLITYLDEIGFSIIERIPRIPKNASFCTRPSAPAIEPTTVESYLQDCECYATTKNATYFGVMFEADLLVRYIEEAIVPTEAYFLSLVTLTEAVNMENVSVRHLFVDDTRIVVVYFVTGQAQNSSKIVVECFTINNGEGTQLWKHTFDTQNPLNFMPADDTLGSTSALGLCDRRFPVAQMDADGNVYILPLCSFELGYGMCSIDKEGNLSQVYEPIVTNYYEPGMENLSTYYLNDLQICGNYLYAFGHDSVYMYQRDLKRPIRVLGEQLDTHYLRGLSVDENETVFLARQYREDDTKPYRTLITAIDTKGTAGFATTNYRIREKLLDKNYDLVRFFDGKLYAFLYDSENSTLTIDTYACKEKYVLLENENA